MRERIRRDGAALWAGSAPLVAGVRFGLFCATALWVPVLLLPGDTMARSTAYAAIVWLARALGVPILPPLLSAGEALLGGAAAALTALSTLDYLRGGGRRAGLRVYLASVFWVAVAVAYVVANPLAYGTWLFVGFALLCGWCLRALRCGGGDGGR